MIQINIQCHQRNNKKYLTLTNTTHQKNSQYPCSQQGEAKLSEAKDIFFIKNPIQHSRIKHIEIKHHFIKHHAQKGDCVFEFVESSKQLADIFTESLEKNSFCIRREPRIIDQYFID